MQYINFQQEPLEGPLAAFMVKPGTLSRLTIESAYMGFLEGLVPGIRKHLIATPASWLIQANTVSGIRKALPDCLEELVEENVSVLYVADANSFKALTGEKSVTQAVGLWFPCAIPKYEHLKIVYGYSPQLLIFNPAIQPLLEMSLQALVQAINGVAVTAPDILHNVRYPEGYQEVKEALSKLHAYPMLTVDIEAFSLRFQEAGVGTIAFAWDQHSGIAFSCDYQDGKFQPDLRIRHLLREFFQKYRGTIIFHSADYDTKVLIYTLWMQHSMDIPGLLWGLHTLYARLEDTRLIGYLALNSTARNSLSLKDLAKPFAGNWAMEDINDITQIPLPDLLRYNLVDACSTWYVYNTYLPKVVAEEQESIYRDVFLPSQKVITQMSLIGMPMNPVKLEEVATAMAASITDLTAKIQTHPLILSMNLVLRKEAMIAKNATLKKRQYPLEHFDHVVFNPASSQDLQKLLYEWLGFPIIAKTDTGLPATGGDVLKKLKNFTEDTSIKELLDLIYELGKVEKVHGTFIKAFQQGMPREDGYLYLLGSFVLGGTVSGRLSSREPNLQNLPAHGPLAKLVKSIFMAPPGWVFAGADFASLEDRINALLTRDVNKLRVYTDGFDGHCLRAYAYFGEEMPDIVDTVESINSIETKYKHFRQESKAPTFALTYQGTYITLMTNQGWTEEKARRIEARYHQLYAQSTKWVLERIAEARKTGYGLGAFGLRIRTPLLAQTIKGGKPMQQAEAEARTLGNAISGQSYGLLTNRAVNAFMARVWASPYRYDILPISLIHDAIYVMFREDPHVLKFVNDHLIKEMEWQELPEIYHPEVTLGAELDVFYQGWHQPITLPNNQPSWVLQELCAHGAIKYNSPE